MKSKRFEPSHEHGTVVRLDSVRGWREQSAPRIVQRALHAMNRPGELRQVLRTSSAMRRVTLNLARYLTNCIPTTDGVAPLLGRCIQCGLDASNAVATGAPGSERYCAYLRGLLYPLPEALEWLLSVAASNGQQLYWNPLESGVLDWWRRSGGVPEVRRRDRPSDSTYVCLVPADFRFLVLVRFIVKGELVLAPIAGRFTELVSRYT